LWWIAYALYDEWGNKGSEWAIDDRRLRDRRGLKTCREQFAVQKEVRMISSRVFGFEPRTREEFGHGKAWKSVLFRWNGSKFFQCFFDGGLVVIEEALGTAEEGRVDGGWLSVHG
jgi:hypothetical protein